MIKLVFVGENRSKTAQDNGWTWQNCATSGKWKLCTKQLFGALTNIGITPKDQIFINLWDDNGHIMKESINFLRDVPYPIVAMGRKVEKILTKENIPHIFIIHPAARGKIRAKGEYKKHVEKILGDLGKKV